MFLKIKKNTLHLFIFLIYSSNAISDSFTNNSFNNHGVVGLVNMPTARFYDESVYGISLYNGDPVQKITFSSNPYEWLEASFFYTNIKNESYCDADYEYCNQVLKIKASILRQE